MVCGQCPIWGELLFTHVSWGKVTHHEYSKVLNDEIQDFFKETNAEFFLKMGGHQRTGRVWVCH